ncbi:DNA-directed RNA polymerase III subunit RPC10 [Lecanosticta acicola]|uniref:DNA-directed RNA polymerase subunit n=1 Tax=Lecanosticta acicola TaxID=111012 RepID=A0AAI8Z048_9PEZI|nr:DNA-directed RNA polymerase III subunit RPC10 [Lecanosticta acicola]
MLIITQIPAAHCGPSPDEQSHAGKNRFECRTCPYQMVLDRRYYERKNQNLKKVDDILGGADSWQNVDQTDAKCANENCDSRRAYFRQVQIRSADEPMTSFYKCVVCSREWREN